MSKALPSTRFTTAARRAVIRAARDKFGNVGLDAFFEHGHWWVMVDRPGSEDAEYYSVVDTRDGFDFEQV